MLLLIKGASGAGKSSVRAAIEPELSPLVECVELADVVAVPAAPTPAWRQRATEAVVRRALERQQSGRHLLLSGDPVAAAEVVAAPSATALDGVAVCLLDVSPEAQACRLAMRGDDPSLLTRHQAFAEWMRRHASDPLHMPHVLGTGRRRLARPSRRQFSAGAAACSPGASQSFDLPDGRAARSHAVFRSKVRWVTPLGVETASIS